MKSNGSPNQAYGAKPSPERFSLLQCGCFAFLALAGAGLLSAGIGVLLWLVK